MNDTRIKHIIGNLQISRDTSTEIYDLYQPLYSATNQYERVWIGLNLIWPSITNLDLPFIDKIKCYVCTFHGDMIDESWVRSQIHTIVNYKPPFRSDILILCNDLDRPLWLDNGVRYHRIEHLHYLTKMYGDKIKHMSRPVKARQHTFSFLSHRPNQSRTMLLMHLYKLGGIISFPHSVNLDDPELLKYCQDNKLMQALENIREFTPCPLDDYYLDPTSTSRGWGVNNIAYQDCLINVVNETSLSNGYMSEKSFKPFISGTLPVFSNTVQINRLRAFGFRINDSYYDLHINDPIMFTVTALKSLLALNRDDLLELVNEHRDHNRNWFFDGFFDRLQSMNMNAFPLLIEDIRSLIDKEIDF